MDASGVRIAEPSRARMAQSQAIAELRGART